MASFDRYDAVKVMLCDFQVKAQQPGSFNFCPFESNAL